MRLGNYLAPLLRTGVISGIALAAAAFPLAAAGGLVALKATDWVDSLPSDLRTTPPAQVSYLYASDGKTLITQFYEEYRHYVSLNDIAPVMQRAIVSSEDTRFYDHHGVDNKGVLRAFVANQKSGGVSQGASTLTMQYVRNVQRDTATTPEEVADATDQTPTRKIREMKLAVATEKKMSKEQILEGYLNVAYFGHQAYGIYAASQIYFSKTPAQLTLPEAAMLAGLVQAPTSYDPASHDQTAALNRRNWVIDRMTDIEYISPEEATAAKATPIDLHLSNPPNDCVSIDKSINDWGFFCDMVKNWWGKQAQFGDTAYQREENLFRGGYSIVTSLDPTMQAAAVQQVNAGQSKRSSLALGLVAVEPGTGLIKAAAVNRNYSLDTSKNGKIYGAKKTSSAVATYPNTVAPLLGMGSISGYQAGSTFKMFTMLAALQQGLPLNTKINVPNQLVTRYPGEPGAPGSCGGYWCPVNASAGDAGVQTMWSGFGMSVNTYFVALEERIGAAAVVQMAENLGLDWHNSTDRNMAAHADDWGAFTLGVADTDPLEMADAYAVIGADGKYCAPSPVLSITDSQGNKVDAADPQCRQAVDPDVARAAADAGRCPPGTGAVTGSCGGEPTAPFVAGEAGRPVSGKTGTTDNARTAWFIGVTPQLSVASFIGDPDNPNHLAGNVTNAVPAQAVAGFLATALAGQPALDFTAPSRQIAYVGLR